MPINCSFKGVQSCKQYQSFVQFYKIYTNKSYFTPNSDGLLCCVFDVLQWRWRGIVRPAPSICKPGPFPQEKDHQPV